ncbi:hypothetical protein [Actinomadura madurae]|uniref:hypothetical protein n=1 Tax=Actinomadura madurae TaxID=1993 RepID=UPI0020D23D79|nr:hypothetical protein [Actinomadura madurae]MCQ0005056.1 hypothetical protein [Actinomadura madurae]
MNTANAPRPADQVLRARDLGAVSSHHLDVQQPRPVPAPDLVADRVARDRRDHRDGEQHPQGQHMLAREDAADHDRGLAGEHEPDEQRRLGEHQRCDDQIDHGGWEPVHQGVELLEHGPPHPV